MTMCRFPRNPGVRGLRSTDWGGGRGPQREAGLPFPPDLPQQTPLLAHWERAGHEGQEGLRPGPRPSAELLRLSAQAWRACAVCAVRAHTGWRAERQSGGEPGGCLEMAAASSLTSPSRRGLPGGDAGPRPATSRHLPPTLLGLPCHSGLCCS